MVIQWRSRINSRLSLKNQQGFSLLEILVAITILGFLMANVYTINTNSTDSKDRVLVEDREKIQLEFAIERIVQDFEQIYSPLMFHSINDPKKTAAEGTSEEDYDESTTSSYSPTKKFPVVTFKGHLVPDLDSEDKSSIEFFTSSHRRRIQDAKQSRYNWVKYEMRSPSEDEKNQREGQVLTRSSISENIYEGDNDWDKVKSFTLLKNVKDFEISYWSDSRKKFVSSPRELNEEKYTLRMIKLSITWFAPDETEIEIIRYVRSLWPYYDITKDEKIIREVFKKTQLENNQNNGGVDEGI